MINTTQGRGRHHRYTCNERFFEIIDTEEKAYWLGFLAADGSIDEKKRSIIFVLHENDADTVRSFRDALSATNPVALYGGTRNRHAKIVVVSAAMISDLKRHGLLPPLSFGIQWPNLQPFLLRHYLRGYSDGDGNFYIGERNDRASLRHVFNFLGPLPFLEGAEEFIHSNGFTRKRFHGMKHLDPRVAYLSYGGRLQVQRIVHLLYDDATIYLPRKRKIAISILDT